LWQYEYSPEAYTFANVARVTSGTEKDNVPPPLKKSRTKYFTPAEVGDKTSEDRTSTNWALVPDASGG